MSRCLSTYNMQALLPSCGENSDSSEILILRWIQIQCSFWQWESQRLPGLKDEEIVVEQVVLSAEIPPGCFFHLASYHPYIVWVFTHHASCTLQVQPHGRWPPPNQTLWSSCWASWWKRGTCSIRWGDGGTEFPQQRPTVSYVENLPKSWQFSSLVLEAKGECHLSVAGSQVEDPGFFAFPTREQEYFILADQPKDLVLPAH